MKIPISTKCMNSVASLTIAILATLAIHLLTAYPVTAQIRLGRITVTIPELPKSGRREKPATPAPAPADTPATNSESRNESSSGGTQPRPQSDARLEILLEEINKRKKEVETFDPSERTELVTKSTPELFIPAISMRARAAYYKRDQLNERQQAAMNPALDSLASAAAKKLPSYKPDASLFAFHNPAAESMMKQSFKNAATLKIHRSGIKESTWLIEKNEFGLPLNRYKHGFIWARDTNDDHPYCRLYTIYIQQNYAGGGTYGELFAHLFEIEIVGCP